MLKNNQRFSQLLWIFDLTHILHLSTAFLLAFFKINQHVCPLDLCTILIQRLHIKNNFGIHWG